MGDNNHGGHRGGGHHNGGHGHHNGGQGGNQGSGQGGNQGAGQEKPSDLGKPVDWMTYSHQALWNMINTGVDLRAAGTAQADWTAVGQALAEVRDLLATAITRSSQAWEGGTADRAREALESVEKWALNTSEHAENVAKCIGTEIEHVQTAREMMPPPAPAPPVVTPVGEVAGTPAPIAATPRSPLVAGGASGGLAGGLAYGSPTSVDSAGPVLGTSAGHHATTTGHGVPTGRSAFAGIDTIAAPAVESVVVADATHRQAAEVMAMFQQNSYAVDRTVPSFSPPTNPVAPPTPPPVTMIPPTAPTTGADGNPVVVNNTASQQQQNNQRPGGAPAAPTPFGRGGFAGGRGGYGGGRGGGGGGVPSPVVAGGGGGSAGPSSPGVVSGALGDRGAPANPGSVTSQFQAPKSVTPQAGMIGAAPIAAPPPVAGAGGSTERDHNRPGYLEDDDNLFAADRKAAPPVIGL
ncbi:PPE domain-containing protein [Saccharothrix sp. BKS2]|uniref:PPE domain-containing protein n=1 Tax=Saccharothrix sp. BKS2 TaxID=3064400 RepID=UPI0039ED82E2